MPDLNALVAERLKLIAQAGDLLKKADARGELSAEDDHQFNRLHDRAAELKAQIDAAARPAATATAVGAAENFAVPVRLPTGALVVGMVNGRPVAVKPDTADAARSRPAYAAAFAAYLRGEATARQTQLLAAMQTDIPSDGGYLAPPQYVAGLVAGLSDGYWFRRLANVRPPTTQPKVSMGSRKALPTVGWSQEVTQTTPDAQMKVGQYNLVPHWMSGEVEVAVGVANVPGGEAAVVSEIEAAGAALEEAAFVKGSGAGQPLGIFTPSESGVPASRDVTGDPTDFDTWIDARLSLPAKYLRSDSLRWVMHRDALKVLAKLKATGDAPIWVPASRPGDQDHVHGTPIELSDDAPTGTGGGGAYQSGDYLAALGDLKMYDIQDGLNFGVARHADSNYSRRGMVGLIFRRKVDGCPRVAEAFARLKVA